MVEKVGRNQQIAIAMVKEILERRAGIEPAITGFADLRVCHFATGAS
jgi:hypothetical protein